MAEAGQLYRQCRERVLQLVGDLSEADAGRAVPACPDWTVHDVVAHLCGVVDDALHGRMEGAPGPAWTAKQVEARKADSVADIVAEWTNAAPAFEALDLPYQAVADVATHEQDLRGALHEPGFQDNDAIAFVVPLLLDGFAARVSSHGLAPLEVHCGPDAMIAGAADDGDLVKLTITPFDFFRASLGRRSRDQVLAMDWQGDAEPYLDHFFIFDPPERNLAE